MTKLVKVYVKREIKNKIKAGAALEGLTAGQFIEKEMYGTTSYLSDIIKKPKLASLDSMFDKRRSKIKEKKSKPHERFKFPM